MEENPYTVGKWGSNWLFGDEMNEGIFGGASLSPFHDPFTPSTLFRGIGPREPRSAREGGSIGGPDVFVGDAQAGVNQGLSGLSGMFPLLGDS